MGGGGRLLHLTRRGAVRCGGCVGSGTNVPGRAHFVVGKYGVCGPLSSLGPQFSVQWAGVFCATPALLPPPAPRAPPQPRPHRRHPCSSPHILPSFTNIALVLLPPSCSPSSFFAPPPPLSPPPSPYRTHQAAMPRTTSGAEKEVDESVEAEREKKDYCRGRCEGIERGVVHQRTGVRIDVRNVGGGDSLVGAVEYCLGGWSRSSRRTGRPARNRRARFWGAFARPYPGATPPRYSGANTPPSPSR